MTPDQSEKWALRFIQLARGGQLMPAMTTADFADALTAYANEKLDAVHRAATHNGALTPSGIEAVIVKAKE